MGDLSSTLLQALNDDDQVAIRECVEDESVKQWIDKRVDHKQLQNAKHTFADTVDDVTCLGFACFANDSHTVRQLVQAGADVTATDSRDYTPLHWACDSEIEAKLKVEYLLSCDASLIKARTNEDFTPLHNAAFSGTDTVISVLIQHGADVNEQGRLGGTALHRACCAGYVACVHELMRHGADVEARGGNDEATPLQLAAFFNRFACVRVLLDKYGASIDATNKFGYTALQYAAVGERLEMVTLLTSYSRGDVTAKNEDGKTQPSAAIATSSVDACNVSDDKKVYGKYIEFLLISH